MPDPQLVKPPQNRRGVGISSIHIDEGGNWECNHNRVFVKSQRDYTCRPLWRALRRTPTLEREHRALRVCHALGFHVPEVIEFWTSGTSARLVLAEVSDCDPLDEALLRAPAERKSIMEELARTVARLHNAGWSHGALISEHILVSNPFTGRISLIDLEKARFNPLRVQKDVARLFRRSEFLNDDDSDTFYAVYHSARATTRRWSQWRIS